MPYIKKERREVLDATGLGILFNEIKNKANDFSVGDMNYIITKLCLAFAYRDKPSYSRCNDIIGILECAKLEYYRRKAAPYEQEKINENGDVY